MKARRQRVERTRHSMSTEAHPKDPEIDAHAERFGCRITRVA